MKLVEAYKAMEALETLGHNEGLTAREAYGIMKLRSLLREDAIFFASKRNDLLRRYGEADPDTPGRYIFTDEEKHKAFADALEELCETPTCIKAEPVILRGDLTGVTADELAALDGLVTVA